ncbi:LOG family protein [Streptomyces niveiscabiei]|uniref:DNA recombination-mediator protein A n=1 Tax=Streptomyces niveiscabiei TaxID=164115 RepID=A0ABW9HVF9_9ACTN
MTTYDTESTLVRSVTITGTRGTAHRNPEEYEALFADYVGPFSKGAHFYIGGAKGIDTLALVWLAGSTDAGITVVVPGTVDQQPAEARQAIVRVGERIGEVVELRAAELKAPAYHARNRWMVDRSSMAIGFPAGGDPASGTWQTLTYTADQGKPRLIVPI